MKVCIDSREQLPLEFREEVQTTIEPLPFGDYWCEIDGNQIPLCFERKSQGDLFGTMGTGYKRFKRELERAKEANFKIILVIESSMSEVARGWPYSKIKGESMLKKLAMLHVRYDLEYHFFNNRKEMARFIEETFEAVERNFTQRRKRG